LGDGSRAFTAQGLVTNHHPCVAEVVYESLSNESGDHSLRLNEIHALSAVKVVDDLFLAAFSAPEAPERALARSGFGPVWRAGGGGFWLEFAAHTK
jgi:hypothetical protein